MKKILLFIFTIIGLNIFSQSLPNSDMEEWDNFIVFYEPDDWFTLNSIVAILDSGNVSVSRSSDSYSGNYSAKLTTHGVTEENYIVPGILTLAEFNINLADSSFSFGGGYFLQENIHKMTGWYKYEGVDDDSASILMYNYKNNNGIVDTLGYGFTVLGNASEWTQFEVYMNYLSYNTVPDTFNVIFSSSNMISAREGSVLFIDSISIHTNTGIADLWSQKKPLLVYPNPAHDQITFKSDKIANKRVLTIFDNFGKTIIEKDFIEQTTKLNISEFLPGFYTYRLSVGNQTVNNGSFIKN